VHGNLSKIGQKPDPTIRREKWFVVGRGLAPAETVGEAISLPFFMITKMREDNILPYTETEKRSGGSKPPPYVIKLFFSLRMQKRGRFFNIY